MAFGSEGLGMQGTSRSRCLVPTLRLPSGHGPGREGEEIQRQRVTGPQLTRLFLCKETTESSIQTNSVIHKINRTVCKHRIVSHVRQTTPFSETYITADFMVFRALVHGQIDSYLARDVYSCQCSIYAYTHTREPAFP